MKRLTLVLALALVAGLAFSAYAEVQNVKVSGDLTVGAVYRSNFDLAKSSSTGDTTGSTTDHFDDVQKNLFSIARVRLDADLTDNVIATVRLLNERNWNGDSTTASESNRNIGSPISTSVADEYQVNIDLAYVTMKEFLYSPLTLMVGRQELRFGNGWLLGDPDTNGLAGRSNLATGDLSMGKTFDAVRATLDYNPMVVDLLMAKIEENNTIQNDDLTLYGINANYALNSDTTLEGFFFSKVRGSNASPVVNNGTGDATSFIDQEKSDKVHTAGARVVNKSIKNLTLDVQAAAQFGTYNPKFDPNARFVSASDKALTSKRRAWGTEAIAMYDLKDCAMLSKWSPMIGGAFVYLSGESIDKVGSGKYHGWDAMFEDQTFGHIINAVMGFTNVTLLGATASAKPMQDVTAKLDYVTAWFNKRFPEGREAILSGVQGANRFEMGKTRRIGQEVDLSLTYDYTEDVQFSLLGGVFMPTKAINEQETAIDKDRATAVEVLGSMKVTF